MSFVRPIGSFFAAVIVAIILGSIASTHFVLGALSDLGVAIPFPDRLAMTIQDIVGIAPLYGAIIGTGLLVAFVAAIFVSKLAPNLRWFVYLVAGGTAVGVTLITLQTAFGGIMPISGARSTGGFIAQIAVGAVAGYVFATLTSKSQTA
ncbi:MAG: hypothetical protein CMI60_07075 [Parvibaculum sp.]|jgi:hypothetical protein|nr:hypothetical protein [Parvibaculum sp.]